MSTDKGMKRLVKCHKHAAKIIWDVPNFIHADLKCHCSAFINCLYVGKTPKYNKFLPQRKIAFFHMEIVV